MKDKDEQIWNKRIGANNEVIKEAKELRKKYKLLRTSIAACALLTTSLGAFMYRHAPVDGAIFYRVGYNDTEMEQTDRRFSLEEDLYETKNGRFITNEGSHKSYITRGDTENGTEKIRVTLPEVTANTSANDIITKKVELKPGVTTIVRTVPTSDETLKDTLISSAGIITILADFIVLNRRINQTYTNEARYRIKNRQLKRKIRRNQK